MKVKFSGYGITAAAGSSGGSVIFNNRSGAIAARKNFPSKKISFAQQTHRSIHKVLSAYWHTLTKAQKLSWRVPMSAPLAKGGNFVNEKITGFNLFIARNYYLQSINQSLLPSYVAPTPFNISFSSLLITFSFVNDIVMVWSGSTLVANVYYLVYMSRYLPTSRRHQNHAMSFISSRQSNVGGTEGLLPFYPNIYGGFPSTRAMVAYKIILLNVSTGQTKVAAFDKCFTAAPFSE